MCARKKHWDLLAGLPGITFEITAPSKCNMYLYMSVLPGPGVSAAAAFFRYLNPLPVIAQFYGRLSRSLSLCPWFNFCSAVFRDTSSFGVGELFSRHRHSSLSGLCPFATTNELKIHSEERIFKNFQKFLRSPYKLTFGGGNFHENFAKFTLNFASKFIRKFRPRNF